MAAAAPATGWARVYSVDPPLSVTARLADARPNIDSGFGGWDEVARPRRKPLTTFKGSPGLHLSLPLLFDSYADGEASIEQQLSQLVKMGQATAGDGEPPRLHVVARGGAVPFQGRTWVVSDLVWGDGLMNSAGNRTRQQVTLNLVEYVEDVYLVEVSAANRRRAKAARAKTKRGANTKRINVSRSAKQPLKSNTSRAVEDEFGAGEDLLSIAARELGDANRWIEIAQLNGLRDPRAIAPNQVLRLP